MINKVIKIQSTEFPDAKRIKIKDGEMTYSMFRLKQDGTETKAYQFFKSLPEGGIGLTVEIGYEDKPGDYQGKPITYHTINVMRKPIEKPNQSERTTDYSKPITNPDLIKDIDKVIANLKECLTLLEKNKKEDLPF
jgi:hypothetical protein